MNWLVIGLLAVGIIFVVTAHVMERYIKYNKKLIKNNP